MLPQNPAEDNYQAIEFLMKLFPDADIKRDLKYFYFEIAPGNPASVWGLRASENCPDGLVVNCPPIDASKPLPFFLNDGNNPTKIACWEGYLIPPFEGDYLFGSDCESGLHVVFAGQSLALEPSPGSNLRLSPAQKLKSQFYKIKVMPDRCPVESFRLFWKNKITNQTTAIPWSALYPPSSFDEEAIMRLFKTNINE
jgi:hypothetical protein